MNYPKHFYFYEKKESELYNNTIGDIVPGRFVAGLPYRRRNALVSEMQPKSLIIADWTAFNWSDEKIDRVKKVVKQFIDDGFPVYLWQTDQIIPMKRDEIYFLDFISVRNNMTPELKEPIIEIAENDPRYHIIATQMHVIDTYELLSLVEETNVKTLNAKDYIDYETKKFTNFPKLVEFLNAVPPDEIIYTNAHSPQAMNFHPKIKSLLNKSFKVNTKELCSNEHALITHLPRLPINNQSCQSITFSFSRIVGDSQLVNSQTYMTIQALGHLTSNMPQLKSFSIKKPPVTNYNVRQIPEISIITLLNSFKNLENLSLEGFDLELKTDEENLQIRLPNLKILEVSHNIFSPKILNELLSSTPKPKLTKLILRDYKFNKLNISEWDLSLLNEIILENCTINSSILSQLSLLAPNITSIRINSGKLIGDYWLPFNFNNLRYLDIIIDSELDSFLEQFLVNSKNLASIIFNFDFYSGTNTKLSKMHHLPKLKWLETDISTSSEIQKIYGNSELFSSNILDQSDTQLAELKTFFLSIKGSAIDSLLINRTVNHLSLTDVSLSGMKATNLSNLKTLALIEDSDAQAIAEDEVINNILFYTPMIEQLMITNVKFKEEDFEPEFELKQFKSLKKIIIFNSNITLAFIKCLIKMSPNLNTLILTKSKCYDYFPDDIELNELCSSIQHVKGLNSLSSLYESLPNFKSPLHTSEQLKNPPCDPIHNSSNNLSLIPTDSAFKFKFDPTNKTKNQTMIIGKLSRYLTLTKQNTANLFKIQQGICNALVHLYQDKDEVEWSRILNEINNWNGYSTPQNELVAVFEMVISAIRTFQFGSTTHEKKYIGDSLNQFLQLYTGSNQRFILGNPWHAIGIRSHQNNYWSVYDPNYPAGSKQHLTHNEMLEVIHKSIGKLVFVNNEHSYIKPMINNGNEFISEGGLLICNRVSNLNEMELPGLESVDNNALTKGLFLRNTKGVPAWVECLSTQSKELSVYVFQLLGELRKRVPDYPSLIQKSMEVMTSTERAWCIQKLTELESMNTLQPVATNTNLSQKSLKAKELSIIIQQAPLNKEDYINRLQPWIKSTPNVLSVPAYCATLITGERKKLITLKTSREVNLMHLQLQSYCMKHKHPFIYINTPEEMICNHTTIIHDVNNPNIGQVHKGYSGALYEFIKANEHNKQPSVLIINYDHFDADDMVRLNSVLDKHRIVDDLPIPETTVVVGLINPHKPHCYKGEDFYSRFNKEEICPFSSDTLSSTLPALPRMAADPNLQVYPVNLFNALDWQERLLGRWVIQKDQFYFEEGVLNQALLSGLPIEIQNGPWGNEAFDLFWEQALVRRTIEYSGLTFHLPASLILTKSQGYNSNLLHDVTGDKQLSLSPEIEALNPSRISEFFRQYQCDNSNQTLNTLPGLIEQHKKKPLEVNVTRELSLDEWAMILGECQKHQVALSIHCALSVPFMDLIATPCPVSPWNSSLPLLPTTVLQSNDTDATLNVLRFFHRYKWSVIDVSECQASDLLTHLDGKMEGDHCSFNQSNRALINALNEHKNVVLKGHFQKELVDVLSTFLIKREALIRSGGGTASAACVILSEDAQAFNYYPVFTHTVDALTKRWCLTDLGAQDDEINALVSHPDFLLEETPMIRLVAALNFRRRYPDSPPGDAWQGINSLPNYIPVSQFDLTNSEHITSNFINQRLTQINDILNNQPYVYVTGLTGVGKSTFIENEFKNEEQYPTVLYSSHQTLDWIKDTSDKRKVLFIDEANLGSCEYSHFEGLFNNPPSILLNGTNHLLSAQHKVVFAGNPLSYGAGRKQVDFFHRHGNALVFTPLPPEFIYEKVIKPVFNNTSLNENQIQLIAHELLHVYQFVCAHATDQVRITPRSLQMMALLTLSSSIQSPEFNPVLIARYYACILGRQNVSPSDRAEFDQTFATEPLPRKQTFEGHVLKSESSHFLITKSREAIIEQLHDCLNLREFKQLNAESMNDSQRYGGLGGMIIEGPPGVGKSQLVSMYLQNCGFVEHFLNGMDDFDGAGLKVFYHLRVGMDKHEREQLLLRAFDEGAVVIVDEINSIPIMERLLNDLLMGIRPKKNDQEATRPTHPGFMIIGTQNPTRYSEEFNKGDTYDGRYESSAAFKGRLMPTQIMNNYNHEELLAILQLKGIEEEQAKDIVTAYESQVLLAEQQDLRPRLTFRHLEDLADWVMHQAKLHPVEKNERSEKRNIVSTSLVHTLWGDSKDSNEDNWINKEDFPTLKKPKKG